MKTQFLLWQKLKIVIDSVEAQIAKELQQKHGLGITEYRALSLLIEAPDSELRMQELAKCLGLNQSSVTRLVERLEKGGHTIRDLCPKDKRGVYTVLTGKGREAQTSAEKDYAEFLNNALSEAALTEDNAEIVQGLREMIQL
ncbi:MULTISPECIES: MarR family winged helix-turn-helix transcriptional regulator [Vibrio]|uniref:MarR family winged helix-turn-helix transcriptional regulator n=1 Tax=Vibrio TaxID=662 RepID=UPI0001B94049|nr:MULTISPECIES: MarR family transcriptional regulator [Vibrio]EEX32492.1 transcriptional regulator MarR family protein [Vibrio coralliilyticus ATCC BAA-450]MCM5507998.1 MarR family transcriptional regulator [Vibrio sp. SCSIO 43169]MDE3897548.1 MarR family transcriptional regulator [Vibrio sp. CC007]NRF61311.1 MarR family transcriptional regulator [Vibrio coralliilyticus]QFT39208.1 HTH-type transcriptional regulator MhqR [Vibrio sp. THAF64]